MEAGFLFDLERCKSEIEQKGAEEVFKEYAVDGYLDEGAIWTVWIRAPASPSLLRGVPGLVTGRRDMNVSSSFHQTFEHFREILARFRKPCGRFPRKLLEGFRRFLEPFRNFSSSFQVLTACLGGQ